MTGMQMLRKGYKMKLLALIQENPDMPEDKIVGILSATTGLKHVTIRGYIEELKDEGRV